MNDTTGKKFEKVFEKDWLNSFPDTFLLRLPDQQSGYFGSSRNLCDFIAFNNNRLYLLECKTIKGNTFPLKNLKQYDQLIAWKGTKDVLIGIILWFRNHDQIIFIPIETFEQLFKDDKKSFNVKYITTKEYLSYPVPSVKKRTFFSSNYAFLKNINV